MSNKYFFLVVVIALTLSACSEEINSDNEGKINNSQTIVLEKESIENTLIEDQALEEEQVSSEMTQSELKQPDAKTIENWDKETSVTTKIEKEDNYYTIYSAENANDSSILEIPLDEKTEILRYKQLDENVIELPTVTENKEVLKERVEEIPLLKLIDKKIVTFTQEPITKGYLIALDMKKLKENYVAISYSFLYNGKEYGIMVSDKKENVGLVLLGNTEGMLEEIKKNSVLNVIN